MPHTLAVVLVVAFAMAASGEAIPLVPPRAVGAIQDARLVAAHRRAAQQHPASTAQPVVPPEWVTQITEMVRRSSRRQDRPAEYFAVAFTQHAKIAHISATFPRNAKRTSNRAGTSHDVCVVEYDQRDRRLVLSPATTSSGPDGYELFRLDQLSVICQELIPIARLQHAFIANGLDYALEAAVIVAEQGKHWAWEIGPAEEQMPNIIYSMTYQPISAELRVVPIEDAAIAERVERAVKQAGMVLKWDRRA